MGPGRLRTEASFDNDNGGRETLVTLFCMNGQRCWKRHEAEGAEKAERAPQGQRRSQHLRSGVVGA